MAKKALIVHTGGGLGDVLLSGPVIDALREANYTVDFLARKSTSVAISNHPGINELLTIEQKDPRGLSEVTSWSKRLRAKNYDLSLLLWCTTRWAWTLFRSGIPKRVGQNSRLLASPLFTHKVAIRSESGDEESHWTDILLDYPRAVEAEPKEVSVRFPLTETDKTSAAQILDEADFGELDGPLLGFHSGKGLPLDHKRWPYHRFAAFAKHLQDSLKARLILTGGPQEIDIVNRISDSLELPHLNLAGKTNLGTLAAVSARCDVFVCPDSGPMHLAAAVGTPIVGIYALDEDFPKRWAPFGVPNRIVRPPRPACRPGCKKPTCPDFSCYLKVQPKEVGDAVTDLIAEIQRNQS